jgi:hypothetical protein
MWCALFVQGNNRFEDAGIPHHSLFTSSIVQYDYPRFLCHDAPHVHSRVKDIFNHDPHSSLNYLYGLNSLSFLKSFIMSIYVSVHLRRCLYTSV